MRIMKSGLLVAICFIAVLSLSIGNIQTSHAAELAGVTLADSIKIGGKDCSLAGKGIRKKFVIKVYVAGLYMENPQLDQESIINSDQAKGITMDFVYKKVAGEKLQSAWREGFDKNTPERSTDLGKKMDQFIAMFTEEAVKGDHYLITYNPGTGTTVKLKDEVKGTIPGEDFMRAVMAIWFGNIPADKGLKKSVLKGMK
jgi:hypothetical protein